MTDLERKLRVLGLWTRFKRAVSTDFRLRKSEYRSCGYRDVNHKLELELPSCSGISSLFIWETSNEGHEFWEEVNRKLLTTK